MTDKTPTDPQAAPDGSVQLQIQLDDELAQGVYVNLAMINHNDSEFILDLLYLQPQQPRAKVRSRAILSPANTKRLLIALQDNVGRYEERFGAITLHQSEHGGSHNGGGGGGSQLLQ